VDWIAGECLVARWRMLTLRPDWHLCRQLREFGLKSSELSLLVAIGQSGACTPHRARAHLHLGPLDTYRNLQVPATAYCESSAGERTSTFRRNCKRVWAV